MLYEVITDRDDKNGEGIGGSLCRMVENRKAIVALGPKSSGEEREEDEGLDSAPGRPAPVR